jgi:hypothetical protein
MVNDYMMFLRMSIGESNKRKLLILSHFWHNMGANLCVFHVSWLGMSWVLPTFVS